MTTPPQRQSVFIAPVALAALALVVGTTACGGPTFLRTANGSTFPLSSKEIGLARDYERGEPQAGDAAARCDYWTKRREDANGNHLIGVFSWPPEYFENLRGWTEAKKAEICEVAKREADAKAATLNETARREALAEAQREHGARDERGWAEARAEACASATTEAACDGVRAYLANVPGGRHAVDAATALEAGTPKIAELRRRREEESARRGAEIAKLEEAAGFRVSALRVTLENAQAGAAPGYHLHAAFDLTALRPIPHGTNVALRARCLVVDKRMVDSDVPADAHLDELAAGDTRELEASPYLKRPLHAAPSQCEVVVLRGSGAETSGPVVDSFCYLPGWLDARVGACPPPSSPSP
jgi:hypothetical protein